MCGAPTVTVLGYQLARRLTEELKMEAILAFDSIRLVEADFDVTPRQRPAEGKDDEADDEAVSEIEFPEEELVAEANSPASEKRSLPAADDGPFKVPEDISDPPLEVSADPTELPEKKPGMAAPPKLDADADGDFESMENDFFSSPVDA